ncbi:hypothetical protein MLD38_003748 [Melastoma candidum]|uniref:Uncharacterized protein n=1 Tax=Melastoma candidum TaxID=119954 RepID=A0ACB9S318_9MYRT|nr:hypothetical protein MLD38_003748 [Melastoma candidum]
MCHYYDMDATVTMSSRKSGFAFHVTRCHQSASLDMYVAEPKTYLVDSWHEMSPGILSRPGVVECVLEAFLSDIGVERHFFPSMVSIISSALSTTLGPCISVDVTLYLFSYEEHFGRERPSLEIRESAGPCSICLEDVHGDRGSNVTELPCLHEFHTECIIRWLCSANTTCPLCRRNVDVLSHEMLEYM